MDISKVIPWVILALVGIAAVAVFAVTLIQASPARRREILNSVLMSLAVEAERLYGAKTGPVCSSAANAGMASSTSAAAAARKLANFLFFIEIPSFRNDCTCAAQLLSL